MYANSTQKKSWTFADQAQIDTLRSEANNRYKNRYRPFLESLAQEEHFLTPDEEALLCKIVTQTGIRFGVDFRPAIWPFVRWTAFAYFKRFYLHQSAMEYFPKNVMMACYYLASKVDEFNVSIDQFVDNLRNGVRENNIETILTLEPELMLKLDYQLTVHCPFRPFEGHMIDMKTKCSFDLDLELIRPHSTEFFKKALVGDAMFLYPPSQIALAGLKYGIDTLEKWPDILRNYLMKLLEIDAFSMNTDEVMMLEKLEMRLESICSTVIEQAESMDPDGSTALQTKMQSMVGLQSKLALRVRPTEGTEPVDSDDEF